MLLKSKDFRDLNQPSYEISSLIYMNACLYNYQQQLFVYIIAPLSSAQTFWFFGNTTFPQILKFAESCEKAN